MLEDWLADKPVIPGSRAIAALWGDLSAAAIQRGRSRPVNDTWIAACCLAYGLPLATLNRKDFEDFAQHHGLRAARLVAAGRETVMTVELINPEDLPAPPTYAHVALAAGTRMVFIAGQEPEDSQGNLIGPGDLAAQARQMFANLGRALAAADASPERVAKITIYVVHHRPEWLPVIEAPGRNCSGITSPLTSW